MDWQERMGAALGYLEANLSGEVELEVAAARANCSPFHFMRMFEVVTGIGPGEYIRRRRLSIAAMGLASGETRVIDAALAAGYDSPDSFARAFRREFGILPSEARMPGAALHLYPPLAFSVVLKGDKAMEYRIEKGTELRLTGLDLHATNENGENFLAVPRFWDEVMADGRFSALCTVAAAEKSRLGILGVCRDFDMKAGTFIYSIAIESPGDRARLPAGCADFSVPASTWAKFTSRGPLRPNFQEMIKRIFSEWFPASGREHAGTAEIEFYPDLPDNQAADYWCEYWVPLK
jgi:AraC family transcriptional regulator